MKIVSLVCNTVEHDSRVLKCASSLARFGSVEIFGFRAKATDDTARIRRSVTITRTVVYNREETRFKSIRRFLSFIEYAIQAVGKCRKSDVIICNDVETLPIGLIAKAFCFRKSLKVIYDSHEYQAYTRWVGPYRKLIIQMLERVGVQYVNQVVVVSPSIARAYQTDYQIALPRVVYNAPPRPNKRLDPRLLRDYAGVGDADTIFLYQGGISQGRGIEALVAAFQRVENANFRLVFMGHGPLCELVRSEARKDPRIVLCPPVQPQVLLDYTCGADFGLLMLDDDCRSHRFAAPNKLFEYLSAGVPVLAVKLPEVEKIITQFSAGVLVESASPERLCEGLKTCVGFDKSHFLKLREDFYDKYSWEVQEMVWHKIMRDIGYDI